MTASRVACVVAFAFASVYAYQDSPIAAAVSLVAAALFMLVDELREARS